MKLRFALAVGLMTLFGACNNDEPAEEPANLVLLGEMDETNTGLTVSLLSSEPLFVGYNELKLKLENSEGAIVSDAEIQLVPVMTMPTMQHSAPVDMSMEAVDENGFLNGAVVFVMPSGEMGSWMLKAMITYNGSMGEVEFDVEVMPTEEAKVVSLITSDDESSLFLSLVQPTAPEVGVNDFEILINKRASMMDWPAEESLQVLIEPEMPTMGHGSPNNVNPSHVGSGHYMGKVNFSMGGYWKVNVVLKRGDVEVGTTSFDITL